MRETYHPAGYDYRSLYSDLTMYRGFEGGAVYVARGLDEWVVITDEGTLIDMLSEEDQAGMWECAIHIRSFTSKDERDKFVSSRWHQKNISLNPQIVGNLGLYYCCYKLSLLGWNVMPTARNARGVDIIAYSSDASRFKGIQVKALSKRNPVPLGLSLDKCMGDFWVIINKVASESPSAFILEPAEIKALAHRSEKNGRVAFWLQPPSYEQSQFKDAWSCIGHGGLDAQQGVGPIR